MISSPTVEQTFPNSCIIPLQNYPLATSVTCATASASSQDNIQGYTERPLRQMQSFHQLSLKQSFHRPTQSQAATSKADTNSVGTLQQQQVNPHPQEQSRLAKLCQQTSNVLASVLPAPFGGLKRSILCQFFGQIPLKGSPEEEAPHTSFAVMQHLPAQSGFSPIALPLPPSGKHPIELVIDQHRRDYLLGKKQQQHQQQQQAAVDPLNNGASVHDLGASGSMLNYAYEKRVEVPKKLASVLKNSGFSAPFDHIFRPATRPQMSSSPLMSTSGWKIFNQFDATTSTAKPSFQKNDSVSTLVASSLIANTTNSSSVSERSMELKQELSSTSKVSGKNEKISMLVIGRPPAAVIPQQRQVIVTKAEPTTTTTSKRMESTKSTTRQATPIDSIPLEPAVRTIEVNAQIMNTSTIVLAPISNENTNASSTNSGSGKGSFGGKPDLNQIRLHEELVIASINNLTRIAFGNHLRDTVKVINKLIDQQSDLFSNHKDPLIPAESKHQPSSAVKTSSLTTPPPRSNSSTSIKSSSRKPSSKDGRPAKSRFLKQASPQHRLSNTSATTTSLESKETATSAFSFPQADDWRRINLPKSGSTSHKGEHTSGTSQIAIIGEMQQDKSPWLISSPRHSTTTASRVPFNSWLSPDKSFTVSTAEDASIDLARKWDSQKKHQAATKQPPGLVLNRLSKDKLAKRDSLTTLKSYLTTRLPPGTTPSDPSQTTGVQSRWMPTVILPGSLQPHPVTFKSTTSTTPSPRPPTTSSTRSSTSSTLAIPTAGTSQTSSESIAVSDSVSSSTKYAPSPMSTKTLPISESTYEARASESINRYTTHLNDPNELLATTRRFTIQPLPQTAQTGEFFNADTIASWPERYQTRIGQAMEGSTASMGDTTRRSGETYQSTTLARHRMDVDSPSTTLSGASSTILEVNGRMTTLPANHKITTLSDLQSSIASLPSSPNPVISTINYSTPSPHSVAYTLIGPYTQSDPGDEFPSISADHPHALSIYIEHPLNGSNVAAPLRPPYADHHSILHQPQTIDDFETMTLVEGEHHHINRTYAQQKLLDMLNPSFLSGEMQNYPSFNGNQHRFNLSALKFLAQNLLSGRRSGQFSDESNYTVNDPKIWADHLLDNPMNEQQLNSSSQQQIRSLLDLLNAAAVSPQMHAGRYDSAPSNDSLSSLNSSSANNGSTSLLGRAGNLLSDLKQLEHRRAAALLAAIRYQIPSPLVRPWEIASGSSYFGTGSANPESRISSRLDSEDTNDMVDDLLLNKLIRMALRKQRVVPRSVLEARLKPLDSHRRLDSIEDTDKPIETEQADYQLVKELIKSERLMPEISRTNPFEDAARELQPNIRKLIREEVKGNFECTNRTAGFYPDTATTCRTFYHCSNTGHLLTFNCPQQSRFDEKTLKCGPWYEVPCDLRRVR